MGQGKEKNAENTYESISETKRRMLVYRNSELFCHLASKHYTQIGYFKQLQTMVLN